MYASKVIFFIAASTMRCFVHLFIAQNTCVCVLSQGVKLRTAKIKRIALLQKCFFTTYFQALLCKEYS